MATSIRIIVSNVAIKLAKVACVEQAHPGELVRESAAGALYSSNIAVDHKAECPTS
jgi:hypothetical protein